MSKNALTVAVKPTKKMGWCVLLNGEAFAVGSRSYCDEVAKGLILRYPAFKLVRMRAKAIVHVEGWEGWRFDRGGALVTPDGRTFQPWELQNLQLVVSLARRYMEARKPAALPAVADKVAMLRVVA